MGDLWTLLIRHPLLALVPAAFFVALAALNGRRFNLVVGGIWTSYALYELGVSLRIFCSGECNIRADLILFYPVLAVLSLIGLGMAFRGRAGRGPSSVSASPDDELTGS